MRAGLPRGWMEMLLLEAAELVSTGVPSFDGAVEYYSTGSVQNGQVQPEGQFTFETRPSRANRWSHTGDVLQARMQGTNKALLINDVLSKKLFSTGFLQLRPKLERCDPRYLRHYVASPAFLKNRDAFATGSTQVALTDAGARKLVIPLAPLPEQRRIVAKLEKLLAKVDACQKRLAKIPVLLKRFHQSVLAAACSGQLTEGKAFSSTMADLNETRALVAQMKAAGTRRRRSAKDVHVPTPPILDTIPEHWATCKVGDLFDVAYGLSEPLRKTAPESADDIPVISMANITPWGGMDLSELKYFEVPAKSLPSLLLHPGDLLLNWRNSPNWIGKTCRFDVKDGRFVNASFLLRLRPAGGRHYERFFHLVFNYLRHSGYFLHASRAAVSQSNFNASEVASMEVPFPPLAEQEEIVRQVDSLFALADQIEARCTRARAHVDNLTQCILAKAFRGELVHSEPTSVCY